MPPPFAVEMSVVFNNRVVGMKVELVSREMICGPPNIFKKSWDSCCFYELKRFWFSQPRLSFEIGSSKKSKTKQRKSAEWGSCAICLDDEPVDPVGCVYCRQLVGCRSCANRWYNAGHLLPSPRERSTVNRPPTNNERCPLCRHEWSVHPEVKEMHRLKNSQDQKKNKKNK
ncbi:hypothetical protein RB195_004496 [Necator americanus]